MVISSGKGLFTGPDKALVNTLNTGADGDSVDSVKARIKSGWCKFIDLVYL